MLEKLQAQKEIKVDGETYVVQLYDPEFGIELYARLIEILGEPLVKLFESFKGMDIEKFDVNTFDLSGMNTGGMSEMVHALFSRLRPKEVVPLIKDILSETRFTPSLDKVTEDHHFKVLFAGRYMHVFKLVGKTVSAQYADFFTGIVKRVSAAKAAKAFRERQDKPKTA